MSAHSHERCALPCMSHTNAYSGSGRPKCNFPDSRIYKAKSHQGAWREEKVELVSGAANAARTRTVGLTHTRTNSGPVRGIGCTGGLAG